MIKLVYSPSWFFGKDLLIDIISLVVLLLISSFAVRCYRLNKNRNYLNFSLSFSLLALSFLSKILTNFTIYYTSIMHHDFGPFILTYQALLSSKILILIGFIGYFFFGMAGLLSLLLVYKKDTSRAMVFLLVYLVLIATYLSMIDYFFFHLTSLLLLVFITSTYLKNYEKNMSASSGLLAYAFLTITFSQLIFTFIGFCTLCYVFAEGVQLAGYLMLFGVFFRIIKNGKKK